MKRGRPALAIVVAVATLAHFTYFFLRYGSFYFPDSFTYLDPAKNMLRGLGFVAGTPPMTETIRTPGYPLILMLFGAHTVPVVVLQHLVAIAMTVGVYVFLRRRGAPAILPAILFAIDIPTIHYANKLLTETIFTAILFVIFLMLLANKHRPIAIGLLLGFLVLVRPIALFLFIPLGFFLYWRRRSIALFIVASLLLPGAWAARNWKRTGVFTVSSIGGINLLTERAAGALAIEDEGDFRADLAEEQNGLVEEADDEIQQKLGIPDAEDLPTAVRAAYYSKYARKVIAQHPYAFAQLTVRGVLVNLFDSDWDAVEMICRLHPSVVQWALSPIPAIVFMFAALGIVALWRRDRTLAVLIAIIVGYFVVISAGAEAESRFRVPVIPQIVIAAAFGLLETRDQHGVA